jgi:hypothetical protein
MNMFCLSTYINKYLKSREKSLEKMVIHKLKRFGDFCFLTQTQTSKWFGFGACLDVTFTVSSRAIFFSKYLQEESVCDE